MAKLRNLMIVPADLADKKNEYAKIVINDLISDRSKKSIRKVFDTAVLDTTALVCIELANELGYKDLALEMIADMESEANNG